LTPEASHGPDRPPRDGTPPEAPPSRRRLRRALWVVASVLVGLLLLTIATRDWILPAILRAQLRRELPKYWSGRLDIDRVRMSLTSPVRLSGITLRDDDERVWARLGSVSLVLDHWPGSRPVVTSVDLDNLSLALYFVDGQCRPPVRNIPDLLRWIEERADIHDVMLREGSITIHRENTLPPGTDPSSPPKLAQRKSFLWNGISFSCSRVDPDRIFHFELMRSPVDSVDEACTGEVTCRGTFARPVGEPVAYEGDLKLVGMDAAETIASAGLDPPEGLGSLDFSYRFSGKGLRDPILTGTGEVRLDPPPPLSWMLRAAASPGAALLTYLGPWWPLGPGHARFGLPSLNTTSPTSSPTQ
jgi:hypothetical protein